jgi:signal transduction histidine kinase
VGFQIYGLAAAGMARGEASARADLAATLGQLRVAQAGLAERARAEERLRIARDLHDELGHGLTALELGLGDLGRRAEAQPGLDALTQAIREAGGLSRDLLERVRAVVTGMRGPPAASIDLAAALRDLVAATAGEPGPEVRLSGEAPFAQVDSGRAEVVLRAAQEAITNSRRHAGPASRLDLELSLTSSGALRLTATDDGAGARQARGGSGLDGMRERATALGGAVAVDTAPGEGFRLQVELPRRGET